MTQHTDNNDSTNTLSRRNFLKTSLAVTAIPMTLSLAGCQVETDEVFAHGVASGDPLADRVIIWTRISIPKDVKERVNESTLNANVKWEVATTPDFTTIVRSGITVTSQAMDFTVKVDVDGLAANTSYYYRFSVEKVVSTVGRTKTLPVGDVSKVNLAFTSCSHHGFGYFNVYRQIAQLDDLDAVLHLGDYLYEYGKHDIYNNAFLVDRQHQPAHEMVSLSDYRMRHAQYKRDVDLQAMHARHPVIAIWDDHEFCNDAWKGGAQNHNPEKGEGDWATRAQHAIKSYYEWMPVREPNRAQGGSREKSFRQFPFGNLVDLNMLDTRFYGRDEQIKKFDGKAELDESRSLLGFEQESWLQNNLMAAKNNGVKWKVLGQQVQMLQLRMFGQYVNADAWDGYQAARNRLLGFIEDNNIDNVVILTGDVHSSWAAEICKDPYKKNNYNAQTGEGAVAVELVTPSVTSPTIPIPGIQQGVGDMAKVLRGENQHIKYIDFKNRGFVRLAITPEKAQAYWHHVPFVGFKNKYTYIDVSYIIKDGESKLHVGSF